MTFNPSLTSAQVNSHRRLHQEQVYEDIKRSKRKSSSPNNQDMYHNRTGSQEVIDSVVNNLTTQRHVNKYCRHCYLKAL
jgi:hypothetical protein